MAGLDPAIHDFLWITCPS